MEYVKTTYTTKVRIVCGCNANAERIIVQDEVSIQAIEKTQAELEKWLIEKASWIKTPIGGIICGRCDAMARTTADSLNSVFEVSSDETRRSDCHIHADDEFDDDCLLCTHTERHREN